MDDLAVSSRHPSYHLHVPSLVLMFALAIIELSCVHWVVFLTSSSHAIVKRFCHDSTCMPCLCHTCLLTRGNCEVVNFTRSRVKNNTELTNFGKLTRIEGYNGK